MHTRKAESSAHHIRTQLCTELRGLIRTGLSGSPHLDQSILLTLPIVTKEAGHAAHVTRKATTFIHIFERIVRVRLSGKDRDTALILFAIDTYAGLPMQDRYRMAAKLYHPHWTWENYRKEPLTRLIDTIINHLEREAELVYVPTHNAEKAIGLIGQQWHTVEYKSYYQFPAGPGDPIVGTQHRILRSMTDGCQVWSYRIRWKLKGRSEAPSVELLGPGTVCITDVWTNTTTGLGFAVVRVELPTPVHTHDITSVSLLIRLPCDFTELTRPGRADWFGLLPAVNTMQQLTVGLRFPKQSIPRAIWKHEALYDGLVHAGIPTQTTTLHLDQNGYVEYTWSPAENGYSHGISMEW